MKRYYVYEIVDPRDDKVFYVGKGQDKRMYIHFNRVKSGHELNNKHLTNKLKQLLTENLKPIYNKVFESNDEYEAFGKEIELIAFYNKSNLCNLTDGGEGQSGRIPSKQTIEKIRNKAIERCKSIEYRKMISEKTKEAMDEPKFKEEFLKRVKSEDSRKNISEKTKEAMNMPEIKCKMKLAQTGENNGFFGHKHTNEWKKSISDKNKERYKSIVELEKLGESIKNSEKYKTGIKNRDLSGNKNGMYGKSFMDIWIEKYGIENAEKKYYNWKLKLVKSKAKLDEKY